MNACPDLIRQQYALEAESVTLGESRYFRELERKHTSDTTPGRKLLSSKLQEMTTLVEAYMARSKGGRPSLAHKVCGALEPEQVAHITLRAVFNLLDRPLRQVCMAITSAVEDHLNAALLVEQHPGLYETMLPRIRKWTNDQQKQYLIRDMLRRKELEVVRFSAAERVQIGAPFVGLVQEMGLIDVTEIRVKRMKSTLMVAPRPHLAEWFERFHHDVALAHPVMQPMIVPPQPWTSPTEGGYLTNLRGASLVRQARAGTLYELDSVDMPAVYAAVNHVQATPWRVNKKVLDVVEAAIETNGERFRRLLVSMEALPLPEKPEGLDQMTPEELRADQTFLAWKASTARTHEANATARSKRLAILSKVSQARRFSAYPAIWFPHNIDFRGRVYPIPTGLTPQADDLGRSLLEFAEGKALGESGGYWLAVHCANTYGNDKVSFDDRVAWAQENSGAMMEAALDPMSSTFWLEADKPWSFLAACFEWTGFQMQGDEYVSHLPIAMDGSCSGLQHFSALLRDPTGGAAVNLVPSERPSDIYQLVADEAEGILRSISADSAEAHLASAWQGKVNRKIAKRPTMTTCYGATLIGMRQMILKDVEDLSRKQGSPYLGEGVDTFEAAGFMARVIYEAIGRVVVAARSAMDWLKEAARTCSEAGEPVVWTAPSGFPVRQSYLMQKGKNTTVFINGERRRLKLRVDSKDTLNKRKQASSISPNFVHALDAAHLTLTMAAAPDVDLNSVAVIHDSFGVHACDTDVLHALIREVFSQMYEGDILEDFAEEISEQIDRELPPRPAGDLGLDLNQVRESDFFFA